MFFNLFKSIISIRCVTRLHEFNKKKMYHDFSYSVHLEWGIRFDNFSNLFKFRFCGLYIYICKWIQNYNATVSEKSTIWSRKIFYYLKNLKTEMYRLTKNYLMFITCHCAFIHWSLATLFNNQKTLYKIFLWSFGIRNSIYIWTEVLNLICIKL